MTPQDEVKTRQMIQDVIGKPIAEILGEIKLLSQDIKTIKENSAKHEKVIENLNQSENDHVLKCPQTKEILEINKKIATMEKLWVAEKAVKSMTWKQAGFGAVIIGLIIALAQLLMK